MRSRPARLPDPARQSRGEGVQRVACYALLVRNEELLLCRLSGTAKPAGQWTLPGGGINFGEHPEKAVIREVLEETGYEVEIDGIAAVDSMLYRYPGPPRHAIRLIYKAHIVGGALKHEAEGTTDRCEWFSQARASQVRLVDLAERGFNIVFGELSR